MKTSRWMLSLLVALLLVAAFGYRSLSVAQEGTRYTPGQCPYDLNKTFWTVAENKNGIEMTATTDKGDVDRLREGFRNLADRQNKMTAGASEREMGGGQGGQQGVQGQQGQRGGQQGQQGMQGQRGGQQGQQGMQGQTGEQTYLTSVPSQVKYDKVKDGARLTITPRNPQQYTMLRNQVWEKAWQLQSGNCAMFSQTAGAGGGK